MHGIFTSDQSRTDPPGPAEFDFVGGADHGAVKNPDDLRLWVLVWIDDLVNNCLTWRGQWIIR